MMSLIEKKFKFEDKGFSCTKIKGIIPYEKFVSLSRFKEEYAISYQIQKGNIKKIKIEVSRNLHQSVDKFLSDKFPNTKIIEKKASVFKCISPYLGIPMCYIFLFIACLLFINSDMNSVRIPVIIYPFFHFILNSTYTKNFTIVCGLILLSILLGLFSYKKDNIIYQYHLNNKEDSNDL
jgi:hypothetical protein